MTDLIHAARRAAASLLFVLLAVPAFAQSQATTGEVKGRIVDAQGAVLPGVSVTRPQRGQRLRSDGRHRRSGAVHDAAAAARHLSRCRWSWPGSPRAKRPAQLTVGASVTLNQTLQLTGVAETITVSAASPLVETSTSIRTVDRRQRGDRQPADQRPPLPGLRHPDPDRPDRHLARPAVVRRPARHQLQRQHRRRRLQPAVLRRPARRRTQQQRLHGAAGRGAGVPGDRRRLLGRVRAIDGRSGQRGDQVGRQPGGRRRRSTSTATATWPTRTPSTRPRRRPSSSSAAAIGGPIQRDRLFFFGAYEQQIFRNERAVAFNLTGIPRHGRQRRGLRLLPRPRRGLRGHQRRHRAARQGRLPVAGRQPRRRALQLQHQQGAELECHRQCARGHHDQRAQQQRHREERLEHRRRPVHQRAALQPAVRGAGASTRAKSGLARPTRRARRSRTTSATTAR